MEGPSPRIVKETKTIQTDPVPGITFQPDPNNYKHFFIELQGISSFTQDHQELAMKTENSRLNFSSQTITPCHLPKSFSTPRSTTLTSVQIDLPRQLRKNLPRYPEEELVTSSPDEISVAVNSESDGWAKPRWPFEQWGGSRMEIKQKECWK